MFCLLYLVVLVVSHLGFEGGNMVPIAQFLVIMLCLCCYKIIPDLPDLHYIQVELVMLSISHVFAIILALNSPEKLIK